MRTRSDREAGFTLIEVMIAFIIVAASIGIIYRGMLDGVAAEHLANAMHEALSRAQSHMDAVGHGMKIGAVSQNGEDGSGFHWRVTMSPQLSSGGLALYHITVTESWTDPMAASGRRALTLSTLRLAAAENPS